MMKITLDMFCLYTLMGNVPPDCQYILMDNTYGLLSTDCRHNFVLLVVNQADGSLFSF